MAWIDSPPDIRIVWNDYKELGQLIDKKLHSTDLEAANAVESLDYRYNIRGWLTDMNEPNLSSGDAADPDDYLSFQIAYEREDVAIGNEGMFNGNISAMKWATNLGLSDEKMRAYNYGYDKMNRNSGGFQNRRRFA